MKFSGYCDTKVVKMMEILPVLELEMGINLVKSIVNEHLEVVVCLKHVSYLSSTLLNYISATLKQIFAIKFSH